MWMCLWDPVGDGDDGWVMHKDIVDRWHEFWFIVWPAKLNQKLHIYVYVKCNTHGWHTITKCKKKEEEEEKWEASWSIGPSLAGPPPIKQNRWRHTRSIHAIHYIQFIYASQSQLFKFLTNKFEYLPLLFFCQCRVRLPKWNANDGGFECGGGGTGVSGLRMVDYELDEMGSSWVYQHLVPALILAGPPIRLYIFFFVGPILWPMASAACPLVSVCRGGNIYPS